MRIVVSIDLPRADPVEAYRLLYRAMAVLDTGGPTALIAGWESTDEWYSEDGAPMPVPEVEQARLAGISAEQDATDERDFQRGVNLGVRGARWYEEGA
jgi:hypothetical protein